MRLPQVSSKTARTTGPAFVGACVNRTPRPFRRAYSHGDIVLLAEAEHLRIEAQRLILVGDGNAG